MKKINVFELHPKVKNLNLSTTANKKKVDDTVEDILVASRRTKNPVYAGLSDLVVKSVQTRILEIESDEEYGCSDAWKHDLGKKLANDYGLGSYCYVNSKSSKRYLFK